MSQIDEKFGKDTLKALGTVTGISKRDYTGQDIPRAKRFKDNLVDFGQTAAASSLVMGNVSGKSLIIPSSILASKVIGARRAIKQHENLLKRKSQEKEEMPKTVAEAVDKIINKQFDEANAILENCVKEVLTKKLFEMKKSYSAKLSEQIVNQHGRIETATGEMVLPSVYRHRRLNEAVPEWERPQFQKDSEKAMEDEDRYSTRRGEEIRFANLGKSPATGERTVRGPQSILDYKKRKGEYFDKAAGAAVHIYGNDVAAAARHMHQLVTGVENRHEPWMVHHEYDDLTKNDFEGHIRRRLRDKAEVEAAATDPAIRAKIDKRTQEKIEAEKRRKEQEMVAKHAKAVFAAKQQGLPPPKSPWSKETEQPSQPKKSVKINDEIPFLEEKVINAIDKAFSKRMNNGKN